ncbi:MAG: GMC oxidoreductase [Acetobacteraceae bacterium]
MFVDTRTLPSGTVLEPEVCIVGAGAAGITLAREFIGSPFPVVLLESGGMNYSPETQDLYAGQSIGRPFETLTTSRLRYFGGTTNHWGGWCLPLDPIDFEPRAHLPYHGWPFQKVYLDPWYRRAQVVCRLGPYDYRPSDWGIRPRDIPPPFAGPDLECKILQVSSVHFGQVYAPELRGAPRVSVYLHANAFRFRQNDNDAAISELSVKTLSGNDLSVRARIYILATGGIENARLLLASGREPGNGLGNEHDLVGRFFMVHLAYSGGVIVPTHPRMSFDFRRGGNYMISGGKHAFVSFIGPTAALMHRLQLPNMMIGWSYKLSPLVHAVNALNRVLEREPDGGNLLADLGKVLGNLEGVGDYGARKLLFGESIPVEAMEVWCASEQEPNPASRIMLGPKRDRLGMPEVTVDWHLVPDDKNKAAATLRTFGAEIGRAGFGRFRPDLVAGGPWPSDFVGNEHQMGTTRMHRDPRLGVVDANCRMHTVPNLYVAGSSVFPAGGANNPTLTIVALALRLADHIKGKLA